MVEKDFTSLGINYITERFIEYINGVDIETLRKSYVNDVVSESDEELAVGKFRLVYIYDAKGTLTYNVSFSDTDGAQHLTVYSVTINRVVVDYTHNAGASSWYKEANVSMTVADIEMLRKLKKLLQ